MKNVTITFLFFCSLVVAYAQHTGPWAAKPKPYKWQLGISGNVVQDAGRQFCQPFDVKESWNFVPFPSSLFFDKHIKKAHSWELIGSYNKYSASKLINDTTGFSGMFLSFDANYKYSFASRMLFKQLDPFVTLGLGFTQRTAFSDPYSIQLGVGGGLNYWFLPKWGLQVRTTGKFAFFPDQFGPSNYFQHHVGVVFRTLPKGNIIKHSRKAKHGWTKKKEKKYKGPTRK
ncbi:MAG: hypothetical protein ACK46Y_02400 [Fluviicola sp.]|jgi:hypothetical protein